MPINHADIAAISTPEEGRAVALTLLKNYEGLLQGWYMMVHLDSVARKQIADLQAVIDEHINKIESGITNAN